MSTCTTQDCTNKVSNIGLQMCSSHYNIHYKQSRLKTQCTRSDCENMPQVARGLCGTHYRRAAHMDKINKKLNTEAAIQSRREEALVLRDRERIINVVNIMRSRRDISTEQLADLIRRIPVVLHD